MKKESKIDNGFENNKIYIESSYINLDNKDYLENYIYSNELSNKINNYFNSSTKKPLYIGIIGTWGSGKTSIVETTLNKQTNETKIFRYDAWKYEDDSFRRNFIQNMLNQSGLKQENRVYREIMESLYEDYSVSFNSIIERMKLSNKKDNKLNTKPIIITIVIAILIIIIGIYIMFKNNVTLGNVLTILGAMGILNIFYSNTIYSKSKLFSSEQFYDSFINIIHEVKGDKNIILIDNLDRCDEEELKRTLSAIKGFYLECDNEYPEKIIFIIPLDINSLEHAYKENKIYYLDKIFDDMIYIKDKYNTDKLDFINRILKEYPAIDSLISAESKSIIINSAINTPREIIKTINDYITEYNLLLNKTNKNFVENSNNRNFLMKMTILKRRYYDFYKEAFNNIEEFIKIVKIELPYDSFEKTIIDEELRYFLRINKVIEPTDYYEFLQNQGVKSYNKIPESVKKAILEHNIKVIDEYNCKEQIIIYYEHIYNDYINDFWEVNIFNKYITLIELYKKNYFTSEEIARIINSWEIIFEKDNFKRINIEKINIIGYENELIFAEKMYKNNDFNIFLLDCLNDNKYNLDNEADKYEMLRKWIVNNNGNILLDNKYSDLMNSYCKYILNNNLYQNAEYLTILFGDNIKLISIDVIKQFISVIKDNEVILQLLNNLKNSNINNSIITDEFVNWLNNNEISNIKVILSIINYLIYNDKDISAINRINIENNELTDVETITSIINIYVKKNMYNNTLFQIIGDFKSADVIKNIIINLTDTIPEGNNEYINNFINYYFGLSIDIEKENIKNLIKIINKYKDYETEIIKNIINKGLLKNYYHYLSVPEEREQVIELSLQLISNNFEKQLENIFIYESSSERMQEFLKHHNNIDDCVKIINKITKIKIKKKLENNLIEIIKEKDNIIKSELESISLLDVNDEVKNKINEILKEKEEKNKELIEAWYIINDNNM